MKKVLLGIMFLLASTVTTSALEALHYNMYNSTYIECKFANAPNYRDQDQVFECVSSSIKMKILGTILFKEGSIL